MLRDIRVTINNCLWKATAGKASNTPYVNKSVESGHSDVRQYGKSALHPISMLNDTHVYTMYKNKKPVFFRNHPIKAHAFGILEVSYVKKVSYSKLNAEFITWN